MTLNLQDSVVLISSSNPGNPRLGTGFVIDREGDKTYLLTCAHVIKDVGGEDGILVEEIPAQCLASSDIKGFDLAVLCVAGLSDKPILKLKVKSRKECQFRSTGFFEYSEEKKRISEPIEGVLGKQKWVRDSKGHAKAWQLKCDENSRLQSGYSGSPIVDSISEQVVGVVTNMEGGGKTGQAISIEALSKIWEDMPPDLLAELPASVLSRFPPRRQIFQLLTTKIIVSPPGFRAVTRTSIVVTILLLIVRFLGILQPAELWAYDRLLIRARPANDAADERIRIIEITGGDKEKYGTSETIGQASLPDSLYNQLFEKLERYEPQTIGLDIYRSFPIQDQKNQYEQLKKSLSQNRHLFVVCKALDPTAVSENFAPPPEVPVERVGFSDFVEDNDGAIRRHLLRMDLSELGGNKCPTDYAFNLQLALHYLGRKPKPLESEDYAIQGAVFTPIEAFTGGYQDVNAGGHQVLLNYRSLKSPRSIARPYTLDDILTDKEDKFKGDIQGKIVLIGISDPKNRDMWSTPYGGEKIPGVFMQAHMVSHILDVANGDRALLWVLPQWGEYLLIWVAAGVGGTLAWFYRPLKHLLIAQIIISGSVIFACWLFFIIGNCWLPIVPSIGASLFSSVGVLIYLKPQTKSA